MNSGKALSTATLQSSVFTYFSNCCMIVLWNSKKMQRCFCFSKIRLPLQRISTAENFEGFYFAISWTELTKVDKSGQRLTDEREGKEQGSDLI